MARPWLVLGLVGAAAYLLYARRTDVASVAESGLETVQSTLTGWQSVHEGPAWLPVLNAAENRYGIPQDLLARIAYQESRFRTEVIDGTLPGGAGELGILQMRPQYFTSVQGARPFTPDQTAAQIEQAAQLLAGLYRHYGDWSLAIAAYNDGQGNVDQYVAGNRALPASTQAYVAAVLGDVPITGVLA